MALNEKQLMIREVVTAYFQDSTINGKPVDLEKIAKEVEHSTEFCILCKFTSYALGAFYPKNSIKFGGREGKSRVVFYGTCKECLDIPKVQELVEKAILANLRTDLH